jgi:hypothetical protein
MAPTTGTTDATLIYRALLVDAKTDISWGDWLQRQSRADDGRKPADKDAQSSDDGVGEGQR